MRSFLSVGAALALGCLSGCQAVDAPTPADISPIALIEAVDRPPGDEVVIPYRKYRLANGLTVILHEDRSDPLVHVDVTYHVGSSREEVGRSGFAHFFEHMMFQGSENVGDDEHFKIVAESGGTLNGTTNTDRTNYFNTAPSNQLEKLLWLEADRMGFLLDAVTQEKFEIQRATVKNERGQNYDNRPYGLVGERFAEALYPVGHPYSWLPIGYVEDLDRVDVDDLKRFFLRWYGPNNAVLSIGGDFDDEEVLAWVEKYFGPIPRGPEVLPIEPAAVTLDRDRYLSYADNVNLPLLYMGFPTVHGYHEDEAPLDVLMFILGVGQTSLLYKNMVKEQIAVQASASHGCTELACTFAISALPNPAAGKTLADLERIARDSLREFEARGATEDDVERVKMTIVSGKIYGLESVAGKVGQLAHYEYIHGNPNFTQADIARYENVTTDDVMRVYRKYIYNQPSVVLSVVPRGGQVLPAKPDNWQRTPREIPPASTGEGLALRRAVDTFDRSVQPAAGANPEIKLPAIWRATLDNGVAVLGARNDETPTTSISLRIPSGQRDESLDQLGLASITASMLNEATLESTQEELSDRLQKLGSSVRFGAGNDYTTATVRSLTRNLDETLEILRERLLEPKFAAADFARIQAQTIQALAQSKKQPSSIAQVVYQFLLLGRDNPISHPNAGTAETVSALTVDDAKAMYAERFSPIGADIIAVSDLDQATLMEKLGVLSAWQGGAVESTRLGSFPEQGDTTIYLVDQPNAAQSEIRIGTLAHPYDATGVFFRSRLAAYSLGGAFNSRINMNLREEKGYTYDASASFSGQEDFGWFTASASVRSGVTAASIAEFENEIRDYLEAGITDAELAFTKSAIGQRDARAFETPGQKLGFLANILTYDLDTGFVDEQKEILEGISADELDAVIRAAVDMDRVVILVVGDANRIGESLTKLGYPIVRLDADGNRLDPA